MRAAVFGAAGYAGAELLQILHKNPYFRTSHAFVSERTEASHLGQLYPRLQPLSQPLTVWQDEQLSAVAKDTDVAFLALPHEVSLTLAPKLLAAGLKVFDLSGAFRLQDASQYPSYYGFAHQHPDLLTQALYALSEWTTITTEQRLFAIPGCYPTASALALLPLTRADYLAPQSTPVINAVSGVSGAGRKASADTSFCEVSLKPYGIFTHRHRPEIEQTLAHEVVFTPHLGAFKRGILTTVSVSLRAGVSADQVAQAFQQAYADKPLIRLFQHPPCIDDVAGTPYADVFWQQQGQQLIVVVAIDNLLKGAAAQAMQIANRSYALAETAGLLEPLL
ncbi:N-acetyl-gamma-glutamyl-phosphate reductase [Idiomarina xiamenensis]|uniref:N-acetyl-gamma-glutamyl-phosphate reductase n=1 Tax=Idiomarina xiamenensis TaxID=1207041 RepID=UPI00058BBF90